MSPYDYKGVDWLHHLISSQHLVLNSVLWETDSEGRRWKGRIKSSNSFQTECYK